jgi:trimeric autotransporter adhesin
VAYSGLAGLRPTASPGKHTGRVRTDRRRFAILLGLVALLCLVWTVSTAGGAVKWKPKPTYQTNGRVRAIAHADGVVYIGGQFTAVRPAGAPAGSGEVPRNRLAALDKDTGALLPWNPGANGTVWSLDVSGGRVYVGGAFTTVGQQARGRLAAVDATTGVVTGWSPAANSTVHVVRTGPNGNVYAGGAFSTVGGKSRKRLAEITPSGTVTSWHPRVEQVGGAPCPPRCAPFVTSLAFSADGARLYFGGHFGLVGGVGRNNAAAVNVAGGSVLAWDPDIFGTGAGQNPNQANKVWSVQVGSDRAYVCGDFWSLDGFQRHPNIAAVDLGAGHLISGFDATTDGGTPACLLHDGLLYVGGHYQRLGPNSSWVFAPGQKATLTGPGSAKRVHIAAVHPTTGAIAAWNPGANSALGVHSLAAVAGGLGAGGDFTRIGGVNQQGYAQFADAP